MLGLIVFLALTLLDADYRVWLRNWQVVFDPVVMLGLAILPCGLAAWAGYRAVCTGR